MSLFGITVLLGIASFVAISHGQCIRIRSGSNSQQPSCSGQCSSCGTSVEDLTALLSIIRALEDRDNQKSGLYNAEDIILQLVNALVIATTNKAINTGGTTNGGTGTNTCTGGMNGMTGTGGMNGMTGTGGMNGMTGTGGTNGMTGTGGTNGMNGTGGTVVPGNNGNAGNVPTNTTNNTDNTDDGLINLDLLQQTDGIEHLLRLGIKGKKLLDLGIGPDDGAVGTLLTNIL